MGREAGAMESLGARAGGPAGGAGGPRPSLSAAEIRGVLGRYALGAVRGIREFIGGSAESPKAVCDTEAGPCLLKRVSVAHAGSAGATSLLHERAAAAGIVAPRIFRPIGAGPGDSPALAWDGSVYVLTAFVAGGRYELSAGAAARAGAALAALQGLAPTPGLPVHAMAGAEPLGPDPTARPPESLGAIASAYPATMGSVNRILASWAWARREVGLELAGPVTGPGSTLGPGWGVVHGDFHPGNTLFERGSLAAVVDFDDAGVGDRSHEAAFAALLFSLPRLGAPARFWKREPDRGALLAFAGAMPDGALGINPAARMALALARQSAGGDPEKLFAHRPPHELMAYVADVCAWLRAHADDVASALSGAGHRGG